ncbi:MAG: amidohydrolase family protein [Armatimonadota bacterium]
MAARALCIAALLPAGIAWTAEAGQRYAIQAGKIVTITRGTIDDGVILIAGGKIEAVGPADRIEIPPGHTLVDASDKWVMPGMVEIHSHACVQGGINDMVCQTNPGMRVGDGVDPESQIADAALGAGVTTITTVPGSGTNHSGFGVTFKTARATKQERLVRRVGVMKIAQGKNPERRTGDIGASRMGMTWLLREHLHRAQEYNAAWDAYERGERREMPNRDIAMEMARPVFRGELPVLVHTYRPWGVMMTMRMFHDEFGLKATATHATWNAFEVAHEAGKRDFAINIGPQVVDFQDPADGRFYGLVPTYRQRGATEMSVNTDATGFSQALLALKAAMAARLGVDDETALRLVTINPAREILLGDRLGSIEPGKDADLVVKSTSLLDPTTPVEMVFVNGKIAYRREAKG